MNTFKEVVQKYSNIPDNVVDEVTEKSPLFGTALWEPTNDGYTHLYEEVKSITAAAAVDLNSTYPTVGADFNLKDKDIALYAGTREVHVNTVDRVAGGSLDTYLDKEMPLVLSQTLMDISVDAYYNVFREVAKAKGKLVQQDGSPSGSKYYSLWAVRYESGNFSGLYNPEVAGGRGLFSATPLSGGARYKNASNKSVYGVDIEMPVGFLPVNGDNISGIVNIDISDVNSTAAKIASFARQVTEQLVRARPGYGGKTYIYGNPILIANLMQYNESRDWTDNGVYRQMWSQVEMIGDWNLLEGTEAAYTI